MPATDNGRIVITGLGAVTPVGNDVDTFWRRMKAGDSGAGPITAFDTDGFKVKIACEVRDFEAKEWLEGKAARRLARATHFAVASAKQAVADAELAIEPATAHRYGITFNTGGGGLASMENGTRRLVARGPQQANPFLVTDVMPNAVSCLISIELGLTGPTTTSTLACASGNYALLEAYRLLRSGEVDAVIAGGTEAGITPLIIATFSRLQALSTRNDDPKAASRPFDADRDGFVFGEGGVAFVVETERHAEQRGARVYAEVRGGAVTADAHHLTAPRPDGSGAAAAMSRALESSRTDPGEVDAVFAHGTATPLGDVAETLAIKKALADRAPEVAVTATKSQVGHMLGAAGAVSALAAVKTIEEGTIPPTINLDRPDPDCDLDYVPNRARAHPTGVALVNAFGFGGQNVVIVLGGAN